MGGPGPRVWGAGGRSRPRPRAWATSSRACAPEALGPGSPSEALGLPPAPKPTGSRPTPPTPPGAPATWAPPCPFSPRGLGSAQAGRAFPSFSPTSSPSPLGPRALAQVPGTRDGRPPWASGAVGTRLHAASPRDSEGNREAVLLSKTGGAPPPRPPASPHTRGLDQRKKPSQAPRPDGVPGRNGSGTGLQTPHRQVLGLPGLLRQLQGAAT